MPCSNRTSSCHYLAERPSRAGRLSEFSFRAHGCCRDTRSRPTRSHGAERRTASITANTGAPGRCPGERLLYDFSVQCEVETVALGVLCHAQADKHLEHAEDDQAGDGIIDEDDGDPDALIEELTDISLQYARRSAVLLDRKYPGQQRPDDTANRMHAEAIQRVVIAEHVLQAGASPVAGDARGNPDRKSANGSHETRSRRNGNKAGDRTG